MMLGGVGLLTGYNGSFPYDKPGDKYDAESTFIGMRTVSAIILLQVHIINLQIYFL